MNHKAITMKNSLSITNKCILRILLMKTFVIVLLSLPTICLKPDKVREKMFEGHYNMQVKSAIMRWWGRNNLSKPIKCNYKTTEHYREYEFIKFLAAPEVKSFFCSGSSTSPRYYFDGLIREGNLEGKGRLVFISNKEWLNLSPSDSKRKKIMAMQNLRVCFKISTFQSREIKEIIGTFRNGSLHGLTKVTYIDNSFYIGAFFIYIIYWLLLTTFES